MKQKLFLVCSLSLLSISLQAQETIVQDVPANLIAQPSVTKNLYQSTSQVKTTTCVDTISYTYFKQAIIGGGTGAGQFGGTLLSQAQGYRLSQTYLNNGDMNINGVEFVGAVYTASGGPAVITVNASIYTVDANKTPITQLGTAAVTMTNTASYAFTYVNFASPIAVNSDYAIVIDVATPNGQLAMYRNNQTVGQTQDEDLARITATALAGSWVSILAATGNAQDWEGIIGPIVSYPITAGFTAATSPACLGEAVVFTSTTTPAGVLSSRMNNGNVFLNHFLPGAVPADSTYTWDMGNGVANVVGSTTTYTYPAAGTYTVTLDVSSGLASVCGESATQTIVINPVPATPTISPAGPLTYCANAPATLTSSAASGNTWSNGPSSASITPTVSGDYTVTVTENGCTSGVSNTVSVTVTPAEDASFSYPSYTLCTSGSAVTATATTAGGTYSSTPAGLAINASTGEIDIATSAEGTYNVTYTTAGSCAGTASHTVVVTSAPDASFSYAVSTYCMSETDPTPSFGAGASAGTFSSTTGLVINASTGEIDLSASTPGTYVITNGIAASGSCAAASATQTVVIEPVAAPDFNAIAPICQGDALTLPATSNNGIAGTWSPAINNTATTTYTFTPANGECASTATLTVTVNTPVTPTFNAVPSYCEGATIPALATTSTNGVTGTWSPAINNTATTTYTFTPGAGQCANTATTTITINDPVTPAFTAIPDLCQNDAAPALPATSNNGIPGTWAPATISTSTVGTSTYTFTPTAGQCADVTTLTVTVEDCLGLDESVFSDLTVFPNPATSEVTVSFTTESAVELTVVTNDGKLFTTRLVEAGTGVSEKIDLNAAAKGVYFIRLATANGTVVRKIVKQ